MQICIHLSSYFSYIHVYTSHDLPFYQIIEKVIAFTANQPTIPFSVVAKKRSSGSSKRARQEYSQPSIEASIQNQTDIRKSNNSRLQMAIADLIHCEGLAFAISESPRMMAVIRVARLVGNDFTPPSRRQVSGKLLTANYNNTREDNLRSINNDAETFGLTFMGDGATIKKLPLINVLCMAGSTLPVVLAINDCSEHIAAGGTKDAPYIAGLFEEHVDEIDPEHNLTDCFFFDGAANVQKAGRMLEAKYPRAHCLHGGEHVISLFFSDLAKMKPIKVCLLD